MQTTDRFTCVSVMCTIVTPVQFEAAFSVCNSVIIIYHVPAFVSAQRVRRAYNFLSPEGLCEHLCTLRGLEGMETGV